MPSSNEMTLWLGTEASLLQLLKARRYALKHPDGFSLTMGNNPVLESQEKDEDEEYDSYLIQREGSIGMINIAGSLVAEDAWYNEWFGLVSYPEIARALQELVADDEVSTILLNIDSGGGTVAGLEEASEAVTWAKGFKKVEAHTSGSMMSAAYWLGSSADSITTTRMSDLGSVGVLLVHRSVYEALKEDGIEYTIIRAGKYKALGHPAEQLSDEAKQIMQGKADTLYGYFLNHVSSERPALTLAHKDAWAEGLTFFGEEAIALGMADRLMSLSDRVESIEYVDKHRQDSNNNGTITSEVNEMPKGKKVVLRSEADKAALESGASLESLDTTSTDVDEPELTAEQIAAEARETAAAEALAEEQAAAGAGADADALGGELVTYLKEQNSGLAAELATAKAEAEQATTALAAAQASLKGLRDIAELHIQGMQIALNSDPIDLSELPEATIVAQHAKVRARFENKFKVEQQSRPVESYREGDVAPGLRSNGIVPKT